MVRPSIRPEMMQIPVIGGHAGATILPLFSQTRVYDQRKKLEDEPLTKEEIEKLTDRVMKGGEEVVNAKGTGSATLSMAQAGAYFTRKVLDGLTGLSSVQCAYVASNVCKDKDVTYFASPVTLGKLGVEEIHEVSALSLTEFEQQKYDAFIPELKDQIKKGTEFGKNFS